MSIKRGKPQITIDTTSLQTNTQFLPTPNSSSIPQETVLRSSNLDDMIEYALSSKRVTKSELIRQAQMIPATTTHHQASINT